ncbi:NFX1-type zinc finger-containing protein 1-like [Montipora capricornis]|uniref:NFX1-type zinc finger-containing protein 1-like n=1 Tax=Montipora capricornis TaxID=246305 RepID=UPI0035F17C28
MVMKNLSCPGNHSQEMACYRDPKLVKCKERCKKDLDCGHRCPGNCMQPCEKFICKTEKEKTYACGHPEKVKCFQFKTATCQAPCERLKECGHVCKGICGNPCSNYLCKYTVAKTLPCNHKKRMPCSGSTNDIKCSGQCLEKLACGHRCPGKCIECRERGSHEFCQGQCNRILVCSHHCKAKCAMPCPPCSRKCRIRCPHVTCSKSCSELCSPCNRPCKWRCNHYQCTRTCQEECDRPRCDAPCPEKLPCGHLCIGLCGEDCPTLCAICDTEELSSMLGDGRAVSTETTRYIQLHNCHHIFTVEEMDAIMQQDLGTNVQLMRCPRCSIPITFSFRYGNLVKKALRNMENVKKEIYKLGNETGRSLGEAYDDTRKYALFASLLELHGEAARRGTSLSTKATNLLKKATNDLILFLQGKDEALIITELESLAILVRREMGLEPLIERPAELQSFPGVGQIVWKLCEHCEVCFTRTVWRKGQEEIESITKCVQCAA